MINKLLEHEISRHSRVVVIAEDVDTLLHMYKDTHTVGIDLLRDIDLKEAIKIARRMRPDKIIICVDMEDINTLDNISEEVTI